jgi:hypothetical protein
VEHIANFGDSRRCETCDNKGCSGANIRRDHGGASEMFNSSNNSMVTVDFDIGSKRT